MNVYKKINRPKKDEYPAYSQHYFDLIKTDDDILTELHNNFLKLKELICALPPEMLLYRYDEGKWTIKEILVHNIDDERVFAYRALRFARNDNTPLHGFEQEDYTKYSKANDRILDDIFEEYWSVRLSTLLLFQNLPEEAFLRKGSGIAGNGEVMNERTVRALAYHIAGHELQHVKIIKERYLGFEVGKYPL